MTAVVIGVFARANHPGGYGLCRGKTNTHGQHVAAEAHGYVVVIVQCADWLELDAVSVVLSKHHYEPDPERPGLNRPMMPPGVDPWKRGDKWYAGPYELVFGAEVADVIEARPMNFFGVPLRLGDRPSYGDNRAMAYLDASEVLDG